MPGSFLANRAKGVFDLGKNRTPWGKREKEKNQNLQGRYAIFFIAIVISALTFLRVIALWLNGFFLMSLLPF
ncbi:MAG: hypothetical protein ACLU9S_08900 [Oscillospiraceae bacterium]